MQWQVGLYAAAVLIPLFAFAVEAIFIRQLKRLNAYIATGAIGLSFLLQPGRLPRLLPRRGRGRLGRAPRRRTRRTRRDGRARRRARRAGESRPARSPRLARLVRLGDPRQSGPQSLRRPSRRQAALLPDRRLHRQPVGRHVPDGLVHRDPHPHLFHGLHARRLAVPAILRVSVALLLLDARARGFAERLHDLHLLGAGRGLLLPLDRLLVRGQGELRRGEQGVHRQPDRRRGDAGGARPPLEPLSAPSTSRRSIKGSGDRRESSISRSLPTARTSSSSTVTTGPTRSTRSASPMAS